jgi:hypothetical protein
MNKFAKISSTLKACALLGVSLFSLTQCADEDVITPNKPVAAIEAAASSTETGAPLSLSISGIHSFSAAPVDCKTCKYVVASNETIVDGAALGIKPGDIICLDAAKKYSSIEFTNILGTLEKPVVIANTDTRIK